jgi:hypothetical protein
MYNVLRNMVSGKPLIIDSVKHLTLKLIDGMDVLHVVQGRRHRFHSASPFASHIFGALIASHGSICNSRCIKVCHHVLDTPSFLSLIVRSSLFYSDYTRAAAAAAQAKRACYRKNYDDIIFIIFGM